MASPALTNSAGIIFALWFGTILCGFSLLCVLATMPIDKAMDERIEAQAQLLLAENQEKREKGEDCEDEEDDVSEEPEPGMNDVFKLEHIFWVLVVSCMVVYGCVLPFNNISSSLLLERDYFMEPPSECQLTDPYECQSETNPVSKVSTGYSILLTIVINHFIFVYIY